VLSSSVDQVNAGTQALAVAAYLQSLQASIIEAVEALEQEAGSAVRFLADAWQKAPGEKLQGQGLTKILEGGTVQAWVSRKCGARSCRLRPPSTGRNWQVPLSRPWACPWSSIRATPMCPRCT
jgi:coproporphyrinogen III oxidase